MVASFPISWSLRFPSHDRFVSHLVGSQLHPSALLSTTPTPPHSSPSCHVSASTLPCPPSILKVRFLITPVALPSLTHLTAQWFRLPFAPNPHPTLAVCPA